MGMDVIRPADASTTTYVVIVRFDSYDLYTACSTYSMERELPSGRVRNELVIVAWERPSAFAIRTTSGPTPFVYRFASLPRMA
jgi:hypothetical protein